jgi:hypothetical protein
MANVDYALRAAYAASFNGGTIRIDDARSLNVGQALTDGAGTISADETDHPLIAALDGYPPLERTGTSNGAPVPHVPLVADIFNVDGAPSTWDATGAASQLGVDRVIDVTAPPYSAIPDVLPDTPSCRPASSRWTCSGCLAPPRPARRSHACG